MSGRVGEKNLLVREKIKNPLERRQADSHAGFWLPNVLIFGNLKMCEFPPLPRAQKSGTWAPT